jgi:putative ABC transport system permease protein
VQGVTASSMLPSVTYVNGIYMKARDVEDVGMGIIYTDHDYLKTLEIKVVEGRGFSKDISTDAREGLLMNRTAMEELGWENAVGEKIELYFKSDPIFPKYQTTLIGIVENFNYHSLTSQVRRILLKIEPLQFRHIMIRIDGQHTLEAVRYIEKTWDAFHFDQPFEFAFLDAEIDNVYRSYSNFGGMIRNATFIAVFIACLGLFGLSSFAVEKRTKEVGIRKVLGASAGGVVLLFTREFTKCVLIANVIAWPIAYYVTNHWMQNFAYRAGIQIWMFILAAVAALMIALATVSFQAIRAATANPTNALRYE